MCSTLATHAKLIGGLLLVGLSASGCGSSTPASPGATGSTIVTIAYRRPPELGPLGAGSTARLVGAQCGSSTSPQTPPFECTLTGDSSGTFVCAPPQPWTIPTYQASCDNTVYVSISNAGSAAREQRGAGISVNGTPLARISRDASGGEVALFSAQSDGRIF
jgi:hypothetical protein